MLRKSVIVVMVLLICSHASAAFGWGRGGRSRGGSEVYSTVMASYGNTEVSPFSAANLVKAQAYLKSHGFGNAKFGAWSAAREGMQVQYSRPVAYDIMFFGEATLYRCYVVTVNWDGALIDSASQRSIPFTVWSVSDRDAVSRQSKDLACSGNSR